ncbi:cobalamin biosynthesis protein CobW [Nocardioides albidus]|uniref:Cobalamin biosynthesis protein CobW n=1 Tax=Nocardioides albidus TaxID=1517589 RepID=A0A5C4VKR4_9ACTN|nr:GTP-binding protein [Nocardioides albidus]TNM36196.1 cobalamin biosynthesis protein CobW [Nocardioides albidus]
MRIPVVLLSGVDPDAMAATMVGLQFDLPSTVACRHHIDVERGMLTRTVSDLTGVVETHETLLEHACVSCAIREDILPTLERLARDGRWRSIVAHLPVGAEPAHLCAALDRDTRLARHLRVSAAVTALSARRPVRDLLGDDLLAERGHHCARDDRRGVGEVLAAMVEHADVVAFDDAAEPVARGLVRTLARPDAAVLDGVHSLGGEVLLGRLHQHERTLAWSSPVRTDALGEVRADGVWRVDLQSLQPFHPDRLLESLEALGSGAHRSRGCFWLPTRPGRALAWDGAGGQLSIGDHASWGSRRAFTRIVLTGVGTAPAHLRPAFEHLLLGPGEEVPRGEDGLEPWLGPIRDAA